MSNYNDIEAVVEEYTEKVSDFFFEEFEEIDRKHIATGLFYNVLIETHMICYTSHEFEFKVSVKKKTVHQPILNHLGAGNDKFRFVEKVSFDIVNMQDLFAHLWGICQLIIEDNYKEDIINDIGYKDTNIFENICSTTALDILTMLEQDIEQSI